MTSKAVITEKEVKRIAKTEYTPVFDGLVVEKGFDPEARANLSLTSLTQKQQREAMRAAKALTETVWESICAEFTQDKAVTGALKEVLNAPTTDQADLSED